MADIAPQERQRLDIWLWHTRVVRARSAAADLVRTGHVRVDGTRVTSAGYAVKVGQVVTVSLDHAVRVLRVVGFAERRGDATSAVETFEDITDLLGK
ncbi:RNA-binding S4 domain-containing protein [Aquabacter spiritensis]|uniref:Ribosome-associated heat shock protein Hsp15 n=1 Tax=Aquabacter spiritensis TaxID=933073 RepID=A0A4R3LYS7_9HYPH|nr:S4 domain-containing protein [Aquabacter spiritensis]TCT03877.1 ribosome-associated heat shock protein Hsp15 [Aquabacter spiritensis]